MVFQSQDKVARRHVRTEVGVDIDGAIETADRKGRATVENISPGGARINTRVPVEPGQSVVLTIGDLGKADGHVAWVNRYTVGVKFEHEVDAIAELLLAVAVY